MNAILSSSVDEYEAFLLATSTLTMKYSHAKPPMVAVFTLTTTDSNQTLRVAVHVDKVGNGATARNAPPFHAHRTEITLGDGRLVQMVVNSGVDVDFGPQSAPPANSMDRDAPVQFHYEGFPDVGVMAACLQMGGACDVLSNLVTPVATRFSKEAAAPQGVRLVPTKEGNPGVRCENAVNAVIVVPTCCSGPVFLRCCYAGPAINYQLQPVAGGDGAGGRWEQKRHTFCRASWLAGVPDGDRLVFNDKLGLRERKDMVATLVFHAAAAAVMPDYG